MKLGGVLKKERENKGLTTNAAAKTLGLSVVDYEQIEAGNNASFEEMAGLVLSFNEMTGGQVSQLYYPCGIPFQTVRDYEVTA